MLLDRQPGQMDLMGKDGEESVAKLAMEKLGRKNFGMGLQGAIAGCPRRCFKRNNSSGSCEGAGAGKSWKSGAGKNPAGGFSGGGRVRLVRLVPVTKMRVYRFQGGKVMDTARSAKTIAEVFEEFLAEQQAKQSPKTASKYRTIISLYKSYLESYWPDHDQEEYNRITEAGGTYCGTFGPEEATAGYSEFLGYFMPRKVLCGKETLKAAGTVTKKLAKWLAEKGYIKDTEDAQERAREAAKDLPTAEEVCNLLDGYIDEDVGEHHGEVIEDHFWVDKIEPGTLWLKPILATDKIIGPVPVPKKVTQLCQEGWDIGGVVVKTKRGWRLTEVWNVTP